MADTNAMLTNPSVMINNSNLPIIPNSLSFTEGLGEQSYRVQTSGGGSVDPVYASNVESRMSTVAFSVIPTTVNIAALRAYKANGNQNTITVTDQSSGLQRTFQLAALSSDYTVNSGADGSIDVEFKSLPAI